MYDNTRCYVSEFLEPYATGDDNIMEYAEELLQNIYNWDMVSIYTLFENVELFNQLAITARDCDMDVPTINIHKIPSCNKSQIPKDYFNQGEVYGVDNAGRFLFLPTGFDLEHIQIEGE